MSTWLSNVVSIVLLTLVWAFLFERRAMSRHVNLLYFAALCLPFAEVLTVKAGMRLIATDWIALALGAMLIGRLRRRAFEGGQTAGIWLAASLGLVPVLVWPFFDPAQLEALAAGAGSGAPVLGASSLFVEPSLTYGVEAVRWVQQCALLVAVVALVRAEKRWERLIDWTIIGSTVNCLYGLYQASRYWWGWVDLPLLPFTYGRHFARADGYPRATGFMWEPTIFGSFTALALLLVLFRLASSPPTRRTWAVLVLHVTTLVLSFSAVGFLAGFVGWTILVLWPAFGRVRGPGARYPLQLLHATAVAGVVLGLLAVSPEVRANLWSTSRKVVPLGKWAPSSKVEKKELLSEYTTTVRSQFGGSQVLKVVDDGPPLAAPLSEHEDRPRLVSDASRLASEGRRPAAPVAGPLSEHEDLPRLVNDASRVASEPGRPAAPGWLRRATVGLGMGQAKYVTGGGLSLPLKVLVEQGLLGLLLLAGLGVAVACQAWRSRLVHTPVRAAFVTALCVSLLIVVATQGNSKINFVFFMAGLVMSVPSPRRPPGATGESPLGSAPAVGHPATGTPLCSSRSCPGSSGAGVPARRRRRS